VPETRVGRRRLPSPAKLLPFLVAIPGLVAFLWQVNPDWKPDPRNKLEASVRAITVDRNVTPRQFIKFRELSAAGFRKEQLDQQGAVVYLLIEIDGRKGHRVDARFSIYDFKTGQRVDPFINLPLQGYEAKTPEDRSVQAAWLPTPIGPHRQYFARIELLDGDTTLAISDTQRFSGRAPPPYR
jgi:hypothetical protein